MKSRLLTNREKEDYGLLRAMLEANRNEVEEESVILDKLQKKCK